VVQYDQTISPGGKGKITLKIQTKAFHGKIHRTARIFSNDPKNPKLTIAITGNLWVPILVSTNRVFLRGMVGEEVTNTVTIKGQKQDPLELIIDSVSPPEKVAVQVGGKEDDGTYWIVFKNLLKDEGFYMGEVKLLTNYTDEPEIRFQILGAIQSLVVTRPKELTFGSMSKNVFSQANQSDGFSPIRQVMVFLTKGDNLQIEKVEMEKPLFIVTKEDLEPGKKYNLVVKPIPEKLSQGQNDDLLRIHTNQEHRAIIEIPVHLNITE
jgi:hypothetical protein